MYRFPLWSGMMRNSLAQTDLNSLLHPQTDPAALAAQGPLILESGDGVYVTDISGRRYIEGMSSLWCASLGFNEPRLAEAAADQIRRLGTYHTFNRRSNPAVIELAERLLALSPMPDGKALFANSGSEAVDTMIKLAWLYHSGRGKPERRKIISRRRAYHGSTVLGATLSGLPSMRGAFAWPDAGVIFAETPHFYTCAEPGESEEAFADRLVAEIAALIAAEGPDSIAAMIAEPVMGAGGVIIPPAGYFPKLAELLRENGILLLSDEVICGFGRTGEWFGCQAFGFSPDMMSVAKALSSGYQPIGATLLTAEIYDVVSAEASRLGVLGHGFTYAGHPVTSAVALETLKIYEELNLLAQVRAKAPVFLDHIKALAEHPLVGDARALGLIGAVELVADRATRRPFAAEAGIGARLVTLALDQGLIVRNLGDTIAICPPLIISTAELDLLFTRLRQALDALARVTAASQMEEPV
ncbi:aminotransferase [Paracoccus sp. APAP_BH8]|uniref:aminotransferase n=1 Tax=Paracoccus sp. APAP_BH8 TaxID=3110237 RepID=UPI002FD7E953